MAEQPFDLLVIGAGASGASVAYEAVRRGLSVALLDAGDIAGGTSCRSTKLLHGGVRYLELAFKTADLAQLKLVREALLERGHWLQQAPFPGPSPGTGSAHRKCSGGRPTTASVSGCMTPSPAARASAPVVCWAGAAAAGPARAEDLVRGAVAYSDGQFDDARLNLLLALTAERAGSCSAQPLPRGGAWRRTRWDVCAVPSARTGRRPGALGGTGDRECHWHRGGWHPPDGGSFSRSTHAHQPRLPHRAEGATLPSRPGIAGAIHG